jgi:hypothetical protein
MHILAATLTACVPVSPRPHTGQHTAGVGTAIQSHTMQMPSMCSSQAMQGTSQYRQVQRMPWHRSTDLLTYDCRPLHTSLPAVHTYVFSKCFAFWH